MHASAVPHGRLAQAMSSSIAEVRLAECERDMPGVAIPCPEIQIVVRFGPAARHGLDAHAFGPRRSVHRKVIRRGQRMVMARLRLGSHASVLGVPASELDGRIVALEDLWGGADSRRLCDRLADAHNAADAAVILERAISERVAIADDADSRLALAAAHRLADERVSAVAASLGVSERHLRRLFHEAFGLGPKAFAQLTRFRRALRVARQPGRINWATIAATAGYYDQSHLIAEFRSIAGVTPRALLGELWLPEIDTVRTYNARAL